MTRRLLITSGVLAAIAVGPGVAAPAQASSSCASAAQAPATASAATSRAALVCVVNSYRRSYGLPALRQQSQLTIAAQGHSQSMAARRFFSHTGPGGRTLLHRLRATGYLRSGGTWQMGENIAWGTTGRDTPGYVVGSWMRSPGHRANILKRSFRDIGIGIAPATPWGQAGATYVLDFGARK